MRFGNYVYRIERLEVHEKLDRRANIYVAAMFLRTSTDSINPAGPTMLSCFGASHPRLELVDAARCFEWHIAFQVHLRWIQAVPADQLARYEVAVVAGLIIARIEARAVLVD